MLIIKHLQRGGYVTPNICYVEETDGIVMKPYIPPKIMITFTINDITYQAEDGMTWGQWVNTEYNTNGFYISYNFLYHKDYGPIIELINYFPISCEKDDLIKNNGIYTQSSG